MRPEDRLQVACAKYLRAALPPRAFFSGIEHARRQSVISGAVQKAKGVKRGLADLNIWLDGKYVGIELKVSSSVSEPQREFGAAMIRNGFAWHVARSVEQVDALLRDHWMDIPASMRIAAMQADAKLAAVTADKPRRASSPRTAKPTRRQVARVEAMRSKVLF
jgi:hypothetical protein